VKKSPTSSAIDQPGAGDYRARAAQTKRTRTRAQILDAVLVAYPGTDPNTSPVVEDVVREAKVSRATFYKYFASLDEAVEELGAQLSDELTGLRASIYSDVLNPTLRVATGFQLFLSRAVIDPDWASFITHGHRLNRDKDLRSAMRHDLEMGVAARVFEIEDMDVALDFIIAAKVDAMRHLRKGHAGRRYINIVTSMYLRSLCVSSKDADAASLIVSQRIHKEGPELLSWWRPFE